MSSFVVLGTDTDAGKTAFCSQWMSAFQEEFAYWKPVETGESDTETIRRLVPAARVFPSHARFSAPLAPVLAAVREGKAMPTIEEVLAAVPDSPLPLLIESFGGPLSPFTEDTLQTELVAKLGLPVVLVTPATVGAVGRVLQAVAGLNGYELHPAAVVLLGTPDAFASSQIERHARIGVFSIHSAEAWTAESVHAAAERNREELSRVREILGGEKETPPSPAASKATRRPLPPGERCVSLRCTGASLQGKRPTSPLAGEVAAAGASPGVAAGEGGALPIPDAAGEGSALPIPIGHDLPTLIQRDRAAVWHPYTSLAAADDPLPVVGAEAEFLELVNDRRVIDGISSWWTILHGHRYPPLMDALRAASERFDHVLFAGVTHPDAVELAERLLATAPWTGGRVFYSDNGSTAVEVALKLAYQVWCQRGEPERQLFVGFENGYHGDTFGAMAAGRDPLFFGRFEPLLFRTLKVPVSADRVASILKEHRGQVAAVILEPLVQGAGGMQMHSPTELKDIFAVTREHGVFFIADEVMTGCGRTGSLWAYEQAGIAPDLICTAKTLAGGVLPLAATLTSPEIVAAFNTADATKTFFHGHSFTAHPLACAIAVANWDDLRTGRWRADVGRIEAIWQERLAPLRSRPGVAEVRIRGSIGAIECAAPGGYLAEVGRRFRHLSLDHGVFLRPLGNVLYAMPPLQTSDDSLHRIADAMTACVNAIQAGGTP